MDMRVHLIDGVLVVLQLSVIAGVTGRRRREPAIPAGSDRGRWRGSSFTADA